MLVFHMDEGEPYMWSCTKKYFKKVKKSLGVQVSQKQLVNQCDLSHYGDNFHIILKMK